MDVKIVTDTKGHEENVRLVNKLYILAVIFCAALALCAVVWAVLDSILVGIILAICSVIIYKALVSNIMYRYLGISYKSLNGSLCITAFYGKNKQEATVPESVIMHTVTEIGDAAFDHKSSALIERIILPASLLKIGKDAFKGCDSLSTVCFCGTPEQWERVEKQTDLSRYTLVFGSFDWDAVFAKKEAEADTEEDAL